jgi:hypothetical protein
MRAHLNFCNIGMLRKETERMAELCLEGGSNETPFLSVGFRYEMSKIEIIQNALELYEAVFYYRHDLILSGLA